MKKNLDTICIHGGWKPTKGEPQQLPIYQSTTFKYETSEQMAKLFDLEEAGYFYTRLANPTVDAVAKKINALEGGVGCVLTSSGQAANFYAVFNICEAGDHFITSSNIYGGTYNLFGVTMKKLGIECTFIDPDWDDERIEKEFRPNTKCFFGETISNPGGNVFDIERFAKMAHRHGVPLIVDNTFATPINCRPFEWGCDIVTHSTTKYMDGHATQVGGAVVDSGNFDWETCTHIGQSDNWTIRQLNNQTNCEVVKSSNHKVPRSDDSRRELPRTHLYKGIWEGRLHNQVSGSVDARPRFDGFTPERFPTQSGT